VSATRGAHFLAPRLAAADEPWSLVNEHTGDVLATATEIAVDAPSRRRGLLGRDSLPETTAFVLAPCSAIHTCFMRFPLDVVCVRADGEVVKVQRDVPPWRIVVAPSAFAVVEWRAGALAGRRVSRGDLLSLRRAYASSTQGQTSICRATDMPLDA
jgi:uncharacterized membrane protein (UPF0127 family)